MPRLNGLPYFEKPPLLYWANAAALRVLGPTPWAARLPTRLAGLGTVILVVLAARGIPKARGPRRGDPAARCAPRLPDGRGTNLTDGLLTFFFTATLLAARAAMTRRARGRGRWLGARRPGRRGRGRSVPDEGPDRHRPARAGSSSSGAWPRGRLRGLFALVASPAPLVFLALAAPWFVVVERRNPGLPPVLLRPRALPALRDPRGSPDRPDLVLRAGVRRRASCPVSRSSFAAFRTGLAPRRARASSSSSGSRSCSSSSRSRRASCRRTSSPRFRRPRSSPGALPERRRGRRALARPGAPRHAPSRRR